MRAVAPLVLLGLVVACAPRPPAVPGAARSAAAASVLVRQLPGVALSDADGVVVSSDNRLVLKFVDSVAIADARTGEVRGTRRDVCADTASFSPAGTAVVLGCRSKRVIWDLVEDVLHETPEPSAAASDGRTIWLSGTALVGSVEGRGLCRFETSGTVAWCVQRAPALLGLTRLGHLAVSDEKEISYLDARSGAVVGSLAGRALGFDAVASRIAVRKGADTSVVDADSRAELARLGPTTDRVVLRGDYVAWSDTTSSAESFHVMRMSTRARLSPGITPPSVIGDSRARGLVATWDLSASGTFVSLADTADSLTIARAGSGAKPSTVTLSTATVDIWLSRDARSIITTPFSVIDIEQHAVKGPPNDQHYPVMDSRGITVPPVLSWLSKTQLAVADRELSCVYDLAAASVACRKLAPLAPATEDGAARLEAALGFSPDGRTLLMKMPGGLATIPLSAGRAMYWPDCSVAAWTRAGEIVIGCGRTARIVSVSGEERWRWDAPETIERIGSAPSGNVLLGITRPPIDHTSDGYTLLELARATRAPVRKVHVPNDHDAGALRVSADGRRLLGGALLELPSGAELAHEELAGASEDLTLWAGRDTVGGLGRTVPIALLERGAAWPLGPQAAAFRDPCLLARARVPTEIELYRIGAAAPESTGRAVLTLMGASSPAHDRFYAMDAVHFTGAPGALVRVRTGTIAGGAIGGVESAPTLRDDALVTRAVAACDR